jgi:hypothetical protein
MRKFTYGSASGWTTKSASARAPQSFFGQAAHQGHYYNRLEEKPFDTPFRPTQNALDLVRDAVSRPLRYSAGQVSRITTYAFPGSLPFLWRPRRNTLLRSCGPLRKGITQ